MAPDAVLSTASCGGTSFMNKILGCTPCLYEMRQAYLTITAAQEQPRFAANAKAIKCMPGHNGKEREGRATRRSECKFQLQ